MVMIVGKEVRCSRCDNHLCVLYLGSDKIVLMQYPTIQIDMKDGKPLDGKILDMNDNEITDGKRIKCQKCTKLNELEFGFAIENAIPRPLDRDKLDTKKSMKWMNQQMLLGRREPKFPVELAIVGNEIFPYYGPKIKLVDEVLSPQGRRMPVYKYETKNYEVEVTFIERPEIAKLEDAVPKGKCVWPLMMLLLWIALEQRTKVVTVGVYGIQKFLSKKLGGSRYKQIHSLLQSFGHSSYKIFNKKNRDEWELGNFVQKIVPLKKDKAVRIYLNELWLKDFGKLMNDERGEYLSFPNTNILKLDIPCLFRSFGIWLARQKGKNRANIKVKNLLRMGYSYTKIARMTIKERWETVGQCLAWAHKNEFLRLVTDKDIRDKTSKVAVSLMVKVKHKIGEWHTKRWVELEDKQWDWSMLNDWVIYLYPRRRGVKRKGKKLTEPG